MISPYPKKSAILCVDYQNEFVSEGGKLHGEVWPMMQKTNMMNKVPNLAQSIRDIGGKVIHSAVVKTPDSTFADEKGCRGWDPIQNLEGLFTAGFWNSEFAKEMAPADSDIVLPHRDCYDAFNGTGLGDVLKNNEIEVLFVTGFLTDFCIAETVRTASRKGIRVYTLSDGCAAKSTSAHVATLTLLSSYSTVLTCEAARQVLQGSLPHIGANNTYKNVDFLCKRRQRGLNTQGSSKCKNFLSIKLKNQFDPATPIYFTMGTQQRSGLRWLTKKVLETRTDIFVPQPLNILRDFMQLLSSTYRNIKSKEDLELLVNHVCCSVEQKRRDMWLDSDGEKIIFDRKHIVGVVMDTIDIIRLVQDPGKKLDRRLYLVAIFDEIMNIGTVKARKRTWVNRVTRDAEYHDLLLTFYGKERLRYIYTVRDPRDLVVSYMNAPAVDCHPYFIATKWAKQQKTALNIIRNDKDLVLQVKYANLLYNNDNMVKSINMFLDNQYLPSTLSSRALYEESMKALLKATYEINQDWHKALPFSDIQIIESVCLNELNILGYKPSVVTDPSMVLKLEYRDIVEFKQINRALLGSGYSSIEDFSQMTDLS